MHWLALAWMAGVLVAGSAEQAYGQAARVEVFGGFAVMRDEVTDLSFPTGWVAGAAGGLTRWLSAVGEIGVSRRTVPAVGSDFQFQVQSFMGGARASTQLGPFTEFAQVLLGGIRERGEVFDVSSTRTAFALQAGVGLDLAISRQLAARVQVDFRAALPGEQARDQARQLRLVVGVALRR